MRFKCPYCNENSNLGVKDIKKGNVMLDITNNGGYRNLKVTYYICQNPDCNMHTIDLELSKQNQYSGNFIEVGIERKMRFKPEIDAEIIEYPNYIPDQILSDYKEACLIKRLSPKASATLSRRCLQGMIRDFWSIKGNSLFDEINMIGDKIDSLTKDAIDAVRSIGNIGAHMEKNINTIIDVDDEEAQLLTDLIETLIEEWYIARFEKELRMKKLIEVKDKKNQLKNESKELKTE